MLKGCSGVNQSIFFLARKGAGTQRFYVILQAGT